MENYHALLGKTREALNAAVEKLQNSFGPDLNQHTAKILGKLTNSRYHHFDCFLRLSTAYSGQNDRNMQSVLE
jgi:hypothetical protein